MPRERATLTLSGALLLFLTLVLTPAPPPPRLVADGTGDVVAFQAMARRIAAGESYYPVFGDELRARGYPAKSVFNWRTPLLLSTLARVPELLSRVTLAGLGLLVFLATFSVTAHGRLWTAASNVMQAGAAVPVLAAGAIMIGEVWAGLLIGLSVCLFALRRTAPAVAIGLLALFVRELAAPYCAACAAAALLGRRWREVAGWVAGACLYGGYYAWHIVQVRAHQLPVDTAHPSPWLSLGGVHSLLLMADWHAWLLPSPHWATAAALSVVIVGAVASRAPQQARVGSAAYVVFFMLAGQSFNGYWALLAWPVWAVASGYGLQALVDAARSLAGPRPHAAGDCS
jgi:hypothetical protein